MANDTSAPNPLDGAFPLFNKKTLATGGGIVILVWLTALLTGSKIVVGIVAVLTLALAGLLVYALRQFNKQKAVYALLKDGQASPEARRAALEQLAAQDPQAQDLLNAIAKAQLQAQDDPDAALKTLEGIDLQKAPQEAADQVRVFRAQILLFKNRAREARDLADQVNVPATGPVEGRAMMAAVVAEAWARTGKFKEALVLLEEFKPDNAELGQTKPFILFARVFAFFAAGQKERAAKDLKALMAIDVNMLGRFVQPGPGIHIELRKMATEVLQTHGEFAKMARAQQRMTQPRGR